MAVGHLIRWRRLPARVLIYISRQQSLHFLFIKRPLPGDRSIATKRITDVGPGIGWQTVTQSIPGWQELEFAIQES